MERDIVMDTRIHPITIASIDIAFVVATEKNVDGLST